MQPNNGVLLIERALTPEGLSSLRAELERRGFRATAGRYPSGYRDNDRLVFDDPALAERLFSALLPHLPAEVTTADGARAVLVGLNPRFRACRYQGGQSFQRHRDGAYSPSEGVRSERTLMLYLTDGDTHQGGRTRFYPSADPDASASLVITPRAGLATVFPHDAWHDGEAVTGGTKVVLRSDLLYRRVDAEEGLHRGHRGYVWDVASSAPGRWLSVGRDGTVRAWSEGESGLREGAVHRLGLASPTALAHGARGQVLVGSRHGRVVCLRVDDHGALQEGPERRAHRGVVLNLAACGHGFVSTGADGVVLALDEEGAPIARHELRRGGFLWGLAAVRSQHAGGGAAADARPTREWLVGGEGGRVHRLLFDGERFHEVARLPLGATVRALAAHATHGTWVGLGDGRLVALHEARGVPAHAGPVTAVAALGDGRVVTGGEDGRVLLWTVSELRAGALARPRALGERGDFITRLVPTPSGHVLAAGYDGQLLRLPVRAEVSRSLRTAPRSRARSAHTPR